MHNFVNWIQPKSTNTGNERLKINERKTRLTSVVLSILARSPYLIYPFPHVSRRKDSIVRDYRILLFEHRAACYPAKQPVLSTWDNYRLEDNVSLVWNFPYLYFFHTSVFCMIMEHSSLLSFTDSFQVHSGLNFVIKSY